MRIKGIGKRDSIKGIEHHEENDCSLYNFINVCHR